MNHMDGIQEATSKADSQSRNTAQNGLNMTMRDQKRTMQTLSPRPVAPDFQLGHQMDQTQQHYTQVHSPASGMVNDGQS